jgi:hypothetical protein
MNILSLITVLINSVFIIIARTAPEENEVEEKDIETSESRRDSQSQATPAKAGYGAAKPDTGYGAPREGRLTKSLEQQALEQRRLQQAQQTALRFRQQQQQQQIQLQQQRQARTFRGHAGQPRFQSRKGKSASNQGNSRRTQNVKFNQGK